MSAFPMDWAIVWVLDGHGLSLGPEIVFVGTRCLIYNILSLVLSTNYILSFEVGGLGRYVFPLDRLFTWLLYLWGYV